MFLEETIPTYPAPGGGGWRRSSKHVTPGGLQTRFAKYDANSLVRAIVGAQHLIPFGVECP